MSGTCRFSTAPGGDVLAWGTVDESRDDRGAVALVTEFEAAEVGFDASSALDGRGFVDPVTGAVLYRHSGNPGGDTLRRFARDGAYPDPSADPWLDPTADDEVAIVTSACADDWGPWLVQGTTGALLYGCPHPGGLLRSLHGSGGAIFAPVKEPLAWSPDGYLLALDGAGVPRVLGPGGAGAEVPIDGLDAGALLAQRTTATGFLVALSCLEHGADELWEIVAATRVATPRGTYPAAPTAYAGLGWEVLDEAGALYGRAFPSVAEVVLKRTLAGTETVYDEQLDAPILQLARSLLLTRP